MSACITTSGLIALSVVVLSTAAVAAPPVPDVAAELEAFQARSKKARLPQEPAMAPRAGPAEWHEVFGTFQAQCSRYSGRARLRRIAAVNEMKRCRFGGTPSGQRVQMIFRLAELYYEEYLYRRDCVERGETINTADERSKISDFKPRIETGAESGLVTRRT